MDKPRRYRKLPVEVTAIQWTGDNVGAVNAFMMSTCGHPARIEHGGERLLIWIEKSQTEGTVRLNDWVIAERDGVGVYPCTAAEFEAIYEPVE